MWPPERKATARLQYVGRCLFLFFAQSRAGPRRCYHTFFSNSLAMTAFSTSFDPS